MCHEIVRFGNVATQARDICRRTWQIDLMLHGDRLIGQVSIGTDRLIMNTQKTNKSSLKVEKSNIYHIISSEKQIKSKNLVLKCSPYSCREFPLPGHLGVKESEAELARSLSQLRRKVKEASQYPSVGARDAITSKTDLGSPLVKPSK